MKEIKGKNYEMKLQLFKLYEVPRNTYVSFAGDPDSIFLFHRIDGMYSYSVDLASNQLMHPAAWTEVNVWELVDTNDEGNIKENAN